MMIRTTCRIFSAVVLVLLAAVLGKAQECGICTETGAESCACTPSVVAEFDYLNWQATVPGSDYAIVEDGAALILGNGNVRRAQPDREAGFRGKIGYGVTSGWRVSFAYTTFDTLGRSQTAQPGGIGQLFATQSHPDGNEEADLATASSSFDYQTFDLVFEKALHGSNLHQTTVFGGVRWADIEQQLQAQYDGRDFTDAQIQKTQTTTGAGLRMGMQTNWFLPHGFYLHGQVSGGLLFAETETTHFENNFNGTDLLVNVRDGRDRSLPFMNTSAGLGWFTEYVSLLVGYELENWFSLHDRSTFVDDLQEATFATISEDVLLSGLFVRATFSY